MAVESEPPGCTAYTDFAPKESDTDPLCSRSAKHHRRARVSLPTKEPNRAGMMPPGTVPAAALPHAQTVLLYHPLIENDREPEDQGQRSRGRHQRSSSVRNQAWGVYQRATSSSRLTLGGCSSLFSERFVTA